jgi:hypothetical protein
MSTESATTTAGRVDRGAVMREAARQFSIMGPLGWTFAKCLAYAWTKLRRQAADPRQSATA